MYLSFLLFFEVFNFYIALIYCYFIFSNFSISTLTYIFQFYNDIYIFFNFHYSYLKHRFTAVIITGLILSCSVFVYFSQ